MRNHESADDPTADLLMAVARSMRGAFVSALREYDVTPAQARALRVVADDGPVRLSALAERLGIAPRSATEVVDHLETRGLVRREPDPDDRRAVRAVSTTEAARLHQRLHDARHAAAEERLARLSAHDRAELERILRLLVD